MKKINLSLQDRSYSIYISKGLIKDIYKYTNSFFPGRKVLVVSDTTVGRLYGRDCVQSLRKAGISVCDSPAEIGKTMANSLQSKLTV